MKATWSLIQDQADRSFGMRVATSNGDDAWPHFFTGVGLKNYPEIIGLMTEETGYDSNGTGISFPAELAQIDPTAPSIPKDHVEVYVPGFEESVIPRSIFYSALLAFGSQLLERPGQSGEWYTALRVALQKLRTKISRDLQS
jgi:hypothetical protein